MFTSILGKLARGIHVVSAFWVLLLGFAIVADVLSRAFLNFPIQGTTEILKNSVVAITFLQLPLAIMTGSMLRTEIVSDAAGPLIRRLLRTITFALGGILFLLIAYSSWEPAVFAFEIGEYEGEGALRVATWPVRFILIATSVFAAIAYISMIWLDWTGQLEDEAAWPGLNQNREDVADAIASPHKGDA
ncbi:TRAP transporter small permease [Pelagibacterium montanilacus]|uniref:TRAP transporter small permease n=1 Tax=Pelagibacterium montanilacus TaxID=2185280 RepID=UPI0013DF2106|nr:TRAP transporter small permease [Pelagibacterium montanilacus]